MSISARSVLMAGVATVTASAVLIAPSVQPAPRRTRTGDPTVAAVQQPDATGPHLLQILLSDPARLLGPAAPRRDDFAAPGSDSIRHRTEHRRHDRRHLYRGRALGAIWIRGAADLRRLDSVGRLARPARSWMFYSFGEGIVASGVFNFTDWLRGDEGAIAEPRRLRPRRRPGIRLVGNRRVELLPPAIAAAANPAAAKAAGGRSVPSPRIADGPDSDVVR